MPEFRDIVVHEDTPELTYHESVSIPDIVPVNLDCNEAASIGRAHLSQKTDGKIIATLFLDDLVAAIADPPQTLLAVNGSDLFEYHGVNYVMKGEVSALALLTGEPLEAPPLEGDPVREWIAA